MLKFPIFYLGSIRMSKTHLVSKLILQMHEFTCFCNNVQVNCTTILNMAAKVHHKVSVIFQIHHPIAYEQHLRHKQNMEERWYTSCFHLPLLASSSASSVPPSGLTTSSPSYPIKLEKKTNTACQRPNSTTDTTGAINQYHEPSQNWCPP